MIISNKLWCRWISITRHSRPSLPFVSQLKGILYSTPPCSRLWVQAFASYLCLSPSTSGLPIPNHAMDVHFEVDYEGIQLCYPEMKRVSRKVLCSSLNVMVYILIRDMLTCYPYFGSADAWVLRNGTYWESKVVVVWKDFDDGTMIKWKDSLAGLVLPDWVNADTCSHPNFIQTRGIQLQRKSDYSMC